MGNSKKGEGTGARGRVTVLCAGSVGGWIPMIIGLATAIAALVSPMPWRFLFGALCVGVMALVLSGAMRETMAARAVAIVSARMIASSAAIVAVVAVVVEMLAPLMGGRKIFGPPLDLIISLPENLARLLILGIFMWLASCVGYWAACLAEDVEWTLWKLGFFVTSVFWICVGAFLLDFYLFLDFRWYTLGSGLLGFLVGSILIFDYGDTDPSVDDWGSMSISDLEEATDGTIHWLRAHMVVGLLFFWVDAGSLLQYWSGESVFVFVLAIAAVAIQLATSISVLTWVYRVSCNARQLGADGMAFTPGWAVGWYFVPIAWFWKPYQAMREIWLASANPSDWIGRPVSPLLPWWWILWNLQWVSGTIVYWWAGRSLDEGSAEIVQASTSIARSLLHLVLVLLLVRIIRGVYYNQCALFSNQRVDGNPGD